jgi:hypothetical protein
VKLGLECGPGGVVQRCSTAAELQADELKFELGSWRKASKWEESLDAREYLRGSESIQSRNLEINPAYKSISS